MDTPGKKDPKPSDPPTDLDDIEERMADYLYNGTVDGEVFDGDPADLDFF